MLHSSEVRMMQQQKDGEFAGSYQGQMPFSGMV
jgi:hypothetical protein